jgi:hypothetical protein
MPTLFPHCFPNPPFVPVATDSVQSCPDGSPCDFVTSTCNGTTEGCIAKGPGRDMFESTEIIAQHQLDTATALYAAASAKLTGSVQFAHTFVDMQNVQIAPEFSTTGKAAVTCKAAMGYAFAGGTTDGPGDFGALTRLFLQFHSTTAVCSFFLFFSFFSSFNSGQTFTRAPTRQIRSGRGWRRSSPSPPTSRLRARRPSRSCSMWA